MERMWLSTDVIPGLLDVWVFRIRGELDHATYPRMKKALQALLDSEARAVVVDFSGIEHLDSTSITFFLNLQRTRRPEFGFLAYASPSVFVERILLAVRAERLIKFHSNVDLAVRSIWEALPPKPFGQP